MLYWTEVVNGDGYWACPKLWGAFRNVHILLLVWWIVSLCTW